MLVSIILGLVEEISGFMYYINAEHPFMVLYRDGRAEFKDPGLQQRKLGIADFNDFVSVRYFQLQTNDTIIVGSDGRDDIILFENEQMNEDENRFLKTVEDSAGDIQEIYQNLKKQGTITDDLSLLKITYKGKNIASSNEISGEYKKLILQALREKNNKLYNEAINLFKQVLITFSDNLFILKQLARISLKTQNFTEVLNYSSRIIEISPSETKFLYLMSIALNKLGQKERAAFYSERVYLREPGNTNNIVHLIKLYISLNQTAAANKYCNFGLQIDSKNSHLRELKQTLGDKPA